MMMNAMRFCGICSKICSSTTKKLRYHKQIACQLRTQYVANIWAYSNTVTLKIEVRGH